VQRSITEVPAGVVDGVNRQFATSATYLPSTTKVYLNGQLKRPDYDDGHVELGGQLIELKEAPLLGDDVQVRYTSMV
jgi:hypothetical protein